MRVKLSRYLWQVAILGFVVLVLGQSVHAGIPARAQSGSITWDFPVRLSDSSSVIQHSTIAADPWGGVHAFWVARPGSGEPSNVIYYAHTSEGDSWRPPTDVFVGADWDTFYYPYALCDGEGQLHLTWVGAEGVYYTSVAALDAGDTKQWQPSRLIVRAGSVGRLRFAVDSRSVLHLIYASRIPGANLQYIRSDDGGGFWTDPLPVSMIISSDPQAVDYMQIVADSMDRLHVVWSEVYPPAWIDGQVFYAKSTDGGNTWMPPVSLVELDLDGSWDTNVEIALDSLSVLHVVSGCGEAERCTRRLIQENGAWTETEPLFAGLFGVSGWDSMVADSYGNVYWFGALRFPQAQYLSVYANEQWQQSPIPLSNEPGWEALIGAHFPHMVLGTGNVLHLVLVEGDKGPLWYVRGQTSYPKIASPLPTVIIDATQTPKPPETPVPSDDLGRMTPLPASQQAPLDSGFLITPVSLGGLSALVLALLAFWIRKRSR